MSAALYGSSSSKLLIAVSGSDSCKERIIAVKEGNSCEERRQRVRVAQRPGKQSKAGSCSFEMLHVIFLLRGHGAHACQRLHRTLALVLDRLLASRVFWA